MPNHIIIIITIMLIFYVYGYNILESFRDLKSKVKFELPGKRINTIPSLDPDLYYKKMFANRDYVRGELINDWLVQPKIKPKTSEKNAIRKLLNDNKWYIFATKDIRRGEEIIIN